MQQKLTLQAKLQQKLVLTPALQQAIKLLPMSTVELAEMLQQEITENPLLEEELDHQTSTTSEVSEASTLDSQADESVVDEQQKGELDTSESDSLREIDYEAFFGDYLEEGYRPRRSYEFSERPPIENTLTSNDSLADHLQWQLRMGTVGDKTRQIGEAIIGNIDNQGYLQASIDELCDMGPYRSDDVYTALSVIQSFDPVGVGSRDLKECLMLQLRHLNLDDSPVEKIVSEHLGLLQKHRFDAIARLMKLNRNEVIAQCEIISSLDPQPGSKFATGDSYYVTPDVYVVKVDGKFEVFLDEERLPKLRISALYRRMLEGRVDDSDSTRDYVKEKLRSALWLIKSVDQRQRTIFKVANSIVRKQHEFLEQGVEYLKPLVLRDVAIDIGMHESTVSRVVSKKYIHTPQGVTPMRYFFHSAISSAGGDSVSSKMIKQRIRKIINDEDPRRPLSDSAIVKALGQEGHVLARRTVAKYREELRIRPSNERKNLYGTPFTT